MWNFDSDNTNSIDISNSAITTCFRRTFAFSFTDYMELDISIQRYRL